MKWVRSNFMLLLMCWLNQCRRDAACATKDALQCMLFSAASKGKGAKALAPPALAPPNLSVPRMALSRTAGGTNGALVAMSDQECEARYKVAASQWPDTATAVLPPHVAAFTNAAASLLGVRWPMLVGGLLGAASVAAGSAYLVQESIESTDAVRPIFWSINCSPSGTGQTSVCRFLSDSFLLAEVRMQTEAGYPVGIPSILKNQQKVECMLSAMNKRGKVGFTLFGLEEEAGGGTASFSCSGNNGELANHTLLLLHQGSRVGQDALSNHGGTLPTSHYVSTSFSQESKTGNAADILNRYAVICAPVQLGNTPFSEVCAALANARQVIFSGQVLGSEDYMDAYHAFTGERFDVTAASASERPAYRSAPRADRRRAAVQQPMAVDVGGSTAGSSAGPTAGADARMELTVWLAAAVEGIMRQTIVFEDGEMVMYAPPVRGARCSVLSWGPGADEPLDYQTPAPALALPPTRAGRPVHPPDVKPLRLDEEGQRLMEEYRAEVTAILTDLEQRCLLFSSGLLLKQHGQILTMAGVLHLLEHALCYPTIGQLKGAGWEAEDHHLVPDVIEASIVRSAISLARVLLSQSVATSKAAMAAATVTHPSLAEDIAAQLAGLKLQPGGGGPKPAAGGACSRGPSIIPKTYSAEDDKLRRLVVAFFSSYTNNTKYLEWARGALAMPGLSTYSISNFTSNIPLDRLGNWGRIAVLDVKNKRTDIYDALTKGEAAHVEEARQQSLALQALGVQWETFHRVGYQQLVANLQAGKPAYGQAAPGGGAQAGGSAAKAGKENGSPNGKRQRTDDTENAPPGEEGKEA
eukprot:scaffold19.g1783.t1